MSTGRLAVTLRRMGSIALVVAAGFASAGCNRPQQPPAHELFVASTGNDSIVTFGMERYGALRTKPNRVIRGAATRLRKPTAVYVLPDGRTFVANAGDRGVGFVTEYAAAASGDQAPTYVIEGSVSELGEPSGIFVGHLLAIAVANRVDAASGHRPGVLEFDFRKGSAPPVGRIAGAATTIAKPLGPWLAPGGTLVLAEPETNRIVGWDYSSGTTLDGPPSFVLSGEKTQLDQPVSVAFDDDERMYVLNRGNASITVYDAGARGDAAPVRRLMGSLDDPAGLAVGDDGDIYVSQDDAVLRFSSGASGAAAANQRIEDPALVDAAGLAIR